MVHLLFGPEVREMMDSNDASAMREFCETLHPNTVAETLAGEFSVEQVWKFLENTSIRNQAAIFEYFPIEWQVKMVEGTGRERMAHLIEKMSHDDRVDLLRRLMPRVSESLLRLVDEADRRDIATLFKHKENTAGRIMTTDYAWLPPNITTGEALERLRLQAPESETIYYLFVLDDQRRLLGVLSLRDLILSPRHVLVRDIMEGQVVSVRVDDDPEHVAKEMARYDLIAIPVIDEQGRMVGIVTHDDVIDIVVQEATEDVHRIGGLSPMAENYLEANFLTIWRKRAFWLACLFIAELFTFTALAHFEDAIAQIVVLSLFVPLCISTGGNSGSQAATLTTRAMALGQISYKDWFRVFRHEIVMGLMLGLTLGSIGFVRAWLTPESVRGNSPPRREGFQVQVPDKLTLTVTQRKEGDKTFAIFDIPAGTQQVMVEDHPIQVSLPEDKVPEITADPSRPGFKIYRFPENCRVRHPPVDQVNLGIVIALSVAAICLWGTLMGSMLPLVFKRFGIDPGIASSPFVATFVDVTGIIIYFSIASVFLLG